MADGEGTLHEALGQLPQEPAGLSWVCTSIRVSLLDPKEDKSCRTERISIASSS